MLERLVYRSKATGEVGSLALFNLLMQARKKNAERDISGHLIFDGEDFTQWIEGPTKSPYGNLYKGMTGIISSF